jgi:hypothetical protein
MRSTKDRAQNSRRGTVTFCDAVSIVTFFANTLQTLSTKESLVKVIQIVVIQRLEVREKSRIGWRRDKISIERITAREDSCVNLIKFSLRHRGDSPVELTHFKRSHSDLSGLIPFRSHPNLEFS